MRDQDGKQHRARLMERRVGREIGRRDFMRSAAKLGLGVGALGLGLGGGRPFGGGFFSHARADEALRPSDDVLAWVKDVASPFRGTTLKLATESTPPSNAINSQLKKYFGLVSRICG